MLKTILRGIAYQNSNRVRGYFGVSVGELTVRQLLFTAWMQWRTGR